MPAAVGLAMNGDWESMSDETELRRKAREAIQAGKFPVHRQARMWGGPGNGAACAICGEPVKRDDVGFELEFAPNGHDPGVRNYPVHIRCFAAWEFERPNLEAAAR
jgi:hypothetical protein